MGFLADVGRSGGLRRLGQQYVQGQTGLLDQAMKVKQMKMQEDELQIKRDVADATIADKERKNRPRLLSDLLEKGTSAGKQHQSAYFGDILKKFSTEIELPDGSKDLVVYPDDIKAATDYAKTQKDLVSMGEQAAYKDRAEAIIELNKQREKAKSAVELMNISKQVNELEDQQRIQADVWAKGKKDSEQDQYTDPYPMNVGGKQVLVRKNLRTNKVEQVSAGPTGTNVSIGDISLSTGTKTELEKGVIKAADHIAVFNRMEMMTDPEFLTYMGQLRKGGEKLAEKAKLPVDTSFLNNYSEWYQVSKAAFLAYRKWVTGVAGGENEMKEIAKSYPNPDTNSYTQFMANLRAARRTAYQLEQRYKNVLATGIDRPSPKQIRDIGGDYRSIPTPYDEPETPTVDITPNEAREELRRRGIIK
jgi:hypothetical protein